MTASPSSLLPLWTTRDVARFLNCSVRQVYNLRQRGLPCVHLGDLVRFDADRVRAWLSGHEEEPDLRRRQLSELAGTADPDNAACAAADLHHEFPAKY